MRECVCTCVCKWECIEKGLLAIETELLWSFAFSIPAFILGQFFSLYTVLALKHNCLLCYNFRHGKCFGESASSTDAFIQGQKNKEPNAKLLNWCHLADQRCHFDVTTHKHTWGKTEHFMQKSIVNIAVQQPVRQIMGGWKWSKTCWRAWSALSFRFLEENVLLTWEYVSIWSTLSCHH